MDYFTKLRSLLTKVARNIAEISSSLDAADMFSLELLSRFLTESQMKQPEELTLNAIEEIVRGICAKTDYKQIILITDEAADRKAASDGEVEVYYYRSKQQPPLLKTAEIILDAEKTPLARIFQSSYKLNSYKGHSDLLDRFCEELLRVRVDIDSAAALSLYNQYYSEEHTMSLLLYREEKEIEYLQKALLTRETFSRLLCSDFSSLLRGLSRRHFHSKSKQKAMKLSLLHDMFQKMIKGNKANSLTSAEDAEDKANLLQLLHDKEIRELMIEEGREEFNQLFLRNGRLTKTFKVFLEKNNLGYYSPMMNWHDDYFLIEGSMTLEEFTTAIKTKFTKLTEEDLSLVGYEQQEDSNTIVYHSEQQNGQSNHSPPSSTPRNRFGAIFQGTDDDRKSHLFPTCHQDQLQHSCAAGTVGGWIQLTTSNNDNPKTMMITCAHVLYGCLVNNQFECATCSSSQCTSCILHTFFNSKTCIFHNSGVKFANYHEQIVVDANRACWIKSIDYAMIEREEDEIPQTPTNDLIYKGERYTFGLLGALLLDDFNNNLHHAHLSDRVVLKKGIRTNKSEARIYAWKPEYHSLLCMTRDDTEEFCAAGDSGSLVLYCDCDNKLIPVGLHISNIKQRKMKLYNSVPFPCILADYCKNNDFTEITMQWKDPEIEGAYKFILQVHEEQIQALKARGNDH